MSQSEVSVAEIEPFVKKFIEEKKYELSDISSADFLAFLKMNSPEISAKLNPKKCTLLLSEIKKKNPGETQKVRPLPNIQSSDQKQVQNSEFTPIEPKYKYNDVGGLTSQKAELYKFFSNGLSMKSRQAFKFIGKIKPISGILLHGPSGCGKTLLVDAVVGELKANGVKISYFRANAPELAVSAAQSDSKIKAIFDAAKYFMPSIIFIDEIDKLDNKLQQQLITIFEQLNSDMELQVFIIGATSDIEKIKDLRQSGRFSREISLGIPDRNARKEILDCLLKDVAISEIDTKDIAEQAEGYIGADLFGLVQEASLNAVQRFVYEHPGETEKLDDALVTQEDFIQAMKVVQPSLRREGFTTTACVKFDAIGGLDDVKKELRTAVVDAIKYSDLFNEYGHKSGSGIILYGPPGCGKTLLARAVANEALHAAFISVKGPELLNKYLGESESAVRGVFQRARDSAPCIIFFDEIDAICPRRSDDSSNHAASRVVNQLLTEMDGVVQRGQIFVIGATNRLELVDEAMLRPGRLDKKIEVPRPDREGRIDILSKIIMRVSPDYVDESIDMPAIADLSEGFSGAELDAIITESTEMAINQTKRVAEESGFSDDIRMLPIEQRGKITQEFLIQACDKIKSTKK